MFDVAVRKVLGDFVLDARFKSEAAVTARQRSYVVFSLCRVRSPRTRGDVHDFYAVTENNPL